MFGDDAVSGVWARRLLQRPARRHVVRARTEYELMLHFLLFGHRCVVCPGWGGTRPLFCKVFELDIITHLPGTWCK